MLGTILTAKGLGTVTFPPDECYKRMLTSMLSTEQLALLDEFNAKAGTARLAYVDLVASAEKRARSHHRARSIRRKSA